MMNRRELFSRIAGGLILGPVSKVLGLDVLVRSQVFPEVGVFIPVDMATQFDFEKLWLEQIRIISKSFRIMDHQLGITTGAARGLNRSLSDPVFLDLEEDDV